MPACVRRLSALALLAAALVVAPAARATEGETDVAAGVLGTLLAARGKGTHLGIEPVVLARHGLTDAFDLAAELSLAHHPAIDLTRLEAHAGVHYVVDVGRFRPHVGLLLGVTDLWFHACPERASNIPDVETNRPALFACGHELRASAVVPLGLEWAPELPIRIGFASRLGWIPFRDDVPDALLTVGAGATFAWVLDDEDP